MTKKELIITIVLALVVLAVALFFILRQPANRTKISTVPSHPQVIEQQMEKKIAASYPHATITPAKSDKAGETVYEVRLPESEARDLPRLHAHIAQAYAEYRRQGYKGKYLIYMGDRVIQSVP